MIEKEKLIEVNGVNLKIKRLDAFNQFELLNVFIPALCGILRAAVAGQAGKVDAFLAAIEDFQLKMKPSERNEILFKRLLSKDSVVQVINGVEMPLIASVDGQHAVTNDNLQDIADLLFIAGEVVQFNFSRFFEYGKKYGALK